MFVLKLTYQVQILPICKCGAGMLQGKWACSPVLWAVLTRGDNSWLLWCIQGSGAASDNPLPHFWLFKVLIQGPMGVQEESNPFTSRVSLTEKYPYCLPLWGEGPRSWTFALCMQSAFDGQNLNVPLARHLPLSFTCQTNAHWMDTVCQALSCSGRWGRTVWSLSWKNLHAKQTEV